jgi:hypothetical protein
MSSIPPSKSALPRALVEAWRADVASPAELRRGYARFTRKPAANRGLMRLASGLALGLILGVGLAQAASVARSRWVTAYAVAARQTATAKRAVPARAARGTPALVPQPSLPVAPEPSATPAPATASPSVQPPPARSAPSAPEGASRVALPSGSSSAPYVQQQWQQAAAALRANDFARAQAALLEVERSAVGSERDAARLARAQLLTSHGRAAEALTLLQELAAHAQSSVVRDQSAGLLARLRENDERHRSTEPGPEIKR